MILSSDDSIRVEHATRYAVIPDRLILDRRVSDRAFRLYALLSETPQSRQELAKALGCSVSTVRNATAELVDAGYVEATE